MQFSSLRVQTGLLISYDIDLARIEPDLPRFIGPPVTLVITQQIQRHSLIMLAGNNRAVHERRHKQIDPIHSKRGRIMAQCHMSLPPISSYEGVLKSELSHSLAIMYLSVTIWNLLAQTTERFNRRHPCATSTQMRLSQRDPRLAPFAASQ